MILDKIKIRISDLTSSIIYHDAYIFGFKKNNDTPNVNAFLNKLIPNLLRQRKERRQKIHDSINTAMEYNADLITQEHIRSYLDTIIDQVYFSDEKLRALSCELWLRPVKDTVSVFDEISESETDITGLTTSACIRSLLNEYVQLPEFIRQTVTFYEEMETIKTSYLKKNILHFTYKDKKYRTRAINYIYGYFKDQNNYLICYDMKDDVVLSVPIPDMKNVYFIKAKYEIDLPIYVAANKLMDKKKRLFLKDKPYPVKR